MDFILSFKQKEFIALISGVFFVFLLTGVSLAAADTIYSQSSASADQNNEFVSTSINALYYENLLLIFDYDAEELDDTDSFTYGWRTISGDNDINTIPGTDESTDPNAPPTNEDEIDSVLTSLPENAQVADLMIYIKVTDNDNPASDSVYLSNLSVTGDLREATLKIIEPENNYDTVYGQYEFTAEYIDNDDNEDNAAWEIYEGTCDSSTGALVGNVDDLTDPFDFTEGSFSAFVDTTQFTSGNYCFSLRVFDNAEESSIESGRTFVIESSSTPYLDQIYGTKWEDVDGDGFFDEDEARLADWEIVLSNSDGEVDRVTTDEFGYYSFNVGPGNWTVTEINQEGWTPTGLRENGESVTVDQQTPECAFVIEEPIFNQNLLQVNSLDFPAVGGDFVTFATAEPFGNYSCDFGNQRNDDTEPEPEPEEEQSSSRSTGTKVGFRNAPSGQVLGASTSNGSVSGTPVCEPYLYDYMRADMVTYAREVMKLQYFLAGQGFFTPVTGIFDDATEANVRLFQAEHALDVLEPWDLEEPTGYVYKTTRWKINNIVCPGSETYPDLTPDL